MIAQTAFPLSTRACYSAGLPLTLAGSWHGDGRSVGVGSELCKEPDSETNSLTEEKQASVREQVHMLRRCNPLPCCCAVSQSSLSTAKMRQLVQIPQVPRFNTMSIVQKCSLPNESDANQWTCLTIKLISMRCSG